MRILTAGLAVALFAASAWALAGDVVVVSSRSVPPDEAADFYYLGRAEGGYLYSGSAAAVARAAPYRVLDRGAEAKDYYLVWIPEGAPATAASFAPMGSVARLSEGEFAVGLPRGTSPAALRRVYPGLELERLSPVQPVEWRADAETPPAKKNDRVAAAVANITAENYGGHIKALQDFKTRYTDTPGFDDAREYVRNFFGLQNLDATYFAFPFGSVKRVYYPDAEYLFVETSYGITKRSGDEGATWRSITATGIDAAACSHWLDGDNGFVAGYNNVLARTADGGRSWSTFKIGSSATLTYRPSAIWFATAETGWLAGTIYRGETPEGEFFFKTADGGRTWRDQQVPTSFAVGWVEFADDRHGWAGGAAGLLYTADGGATWRTSNGPGGMVDFSAAAPKVAWATAGDGRLYRTVNGVDWRQVNPGVSGLLWRVDFVDAARGFAIGDKFVKTVDGGASWREAGAPPTATCNAFDFADADRGLVGYTFEGKLYLTTDGGAHFRDISGDVDLYAENVVGERRGTAKPAEIVIIGGHLDCTSELPMWNAPGAEDNASGVACALAAAAAFKNVSFRRTVRYIAFGGEEEGIFGSSAYVAECARKGEKIVAFLNADMVAFDEEKGLRDDYGLAYGDYKWLYDYARKVGSLYGNDIIYERFEYRGSDHKPFWDHGYPALAAIHGRADMGVTKGYVWYHTTEDTYDKLSPELAYRFVRDYAATLAHLAGPAGNFPDPPPPPAGAVPYSRAFAVYPNPYCYAAAAGGVNFVGIQTPATVRIYDLAGRRVASAAVAAPTDEFVWRPGGETLSPGVYLYRVEGREQAESGKIIITK